MSRANIESVCQIRTMYNLSCEKCQFNAECTNYQNKKEIKENEKVKGKQRSKRNQSNKG